MPTTSLLPAVSVLCLSLLSPAFSEERKEPPAKESRANPRAERGDERKITFLGVSTFHLSPDLREHLEIPEGFGIQVHEVVPGSPAEKAGLKKNDILLRFRDQVLISPEHLSLLVKQEADQSGIDLTVIRKGSEETITVSLEQIAANSPHIRPRPDVPPVSPEEWQQRIKEQQDYWQRWMDQRRPGPDRPRPGDAPKPATPGMTGRPPAVSVNPGFPVRIFGTEGVIKIDNDEGEVSIINDGDGHEIVIKDAQGVEIFSGSYDANLGIESLPEAAQEHLRKMKLENLEVLAPKLAEEGPEKTAAPASSAPPEESEDLL